MSRRKLLIGAGGTGLAGALAVGLWLGGSSAAVNLSLSADSVHHNPPACAPQHKRHHRHHPRPVPPMGVKVPPRLPHPPGPVATPQAAGPTPTVSPRHTPGPPPTVSPRHTPGPTPTVTR